MRIVGPDEIVFGVEDIEDCAKFVTDFGLKDVGNGYYEALDGTCLVLKKHDDPSLPPSLPSGSKHRQTVWGVADAAALDEIETELSTDRRVVRRADGSLETADDL